MTRKHYIAIAEALSRTRPERPWLRAQTCTHWAQWAVTRDAIASTLQLDNQRFDRALFIAATER